jgi:hypothetical protein
MGFFSNIKNRARGQVAPVMPMAPVRQDTRVPLIPGMKPQSPVGLPDANGYYPGDDRYGGGFTKGPGGYQRPQLRPQLPKPNLPTLKPNDSRPALPVAQTIQGRLDDLNPGMPSKQEYLDQRGPDMPRLDREMAKVNPIRPGMDDGRVYAGGSPGLYAPGGRFNPGNIGGRISESSYSPLELAERKARARVEAGKQDLFQKNRKDRSKKQGGLGGLLPQQNLDFLNKLPKNMMPNLDFSNLPQGLPQGGGGEFNFADYQPQNRQMMRFGGEMRPGYLNGRDVNIDDGGMVDFLNSNPEQVLFGIENRIGILQNQLQEAESNRDRESYDMIVQEINNADAQRIEIMNSMKPNVDRMIEAGRGRTLSNRDREILGETGRTISDMDRGYIDDILSSLEKKN